MNVTDLMADQYRCPHGPLAPVVARRLNQRNRPLIRATIEALEIASHHRVLDVGFGGAVSLELVALQAPEGHVAGVDPSQEMVDLASRRLARLIGENRVSVRSGGVDDLPYESATFDRILTCHTVYFWTDLRAGLAEIARVLRPGGRFAVTMMPLDVQRVFEFDRRGYRTVGHDELILHLEESGFIKVRMWPRPSGGQSWIVVASRP